MRNNAEQYSPLTAQESTARACQAAASEHTAGCKPRPCDGDSPLVKRAREELLLQWMWLCSLVAQTGAQLCQKT